MNGDNILQAGDAAIVSYETDTSAGGSPDAIRIVLLTDIAAGTVIYLTDRSWNGTAFAAASAGEGTLTYTAPGALSAGTVLTFTFAQLGAAGITLSNAGETLYLYQGTSADAPTRFIFAADIADGNPVFNGSLVNTGLTNGVNAVAVAADNATYQGAPTGIASTTLAGIATTTRWYGTDTDDIPGTTGFSEVIVTDVPGPFLDGNDFVILSALVGGGQSDALLRIGAEDGANSAQNLTRLFRDNPAFNHVSDVAFDLDSGYFFFVDSDGNSINRIMRGNIADLVSGTSTPSFTQLFATDGFGEIIMSIELNKATNKIVFLDGSLTGDFEGGWEVRTMNYDGTANTVVAVIDTENQGPSVFGVTGVADYALRESTNTLYIAASLAGIDGLGNASIFQNHIMSVNLTTGAITTLLLGNADPRSINGDPNYANGRLNPDEGQIIAIDVDQNTGIIYFLTQPRSANHSGGVWSYDPATDDLVELWNQPTPASYTTLQSFPTGNMTFIEVDEIGGRIYITTSGSIDHENDGTPGTNEHDASIHYLAIGAAVGTAPTRFVRIYEPTALGAPLGLEIDYDANVTVTSSNATYTETAGLNSPAGTGVAPFTGATIADPDQSTLYGAQVAITSGFVPGDILAFTNSGGITGSYDSATGVVTFTGAATLAQYQTVLNSIRFANAGDNPTNYGANGTRDISINVFDGLTWGDLHTVSLTVTGVNDAPVNTVGGTATVGEDSANNALTGISISDADADPANQDVTVTLSVGHGTLTIRTDVSGGIVAGDITGGANGSATITITATQNQINATLANATGLRYTPVANYNGADALTIVTSDNGLNGSGGALSDTDTKTISITEANDAPGVSGDGTESLADIAEDTPFTNANAPTVAAAVGGQFSDATDVQNGGGNSTGSAGDGLAGIAIVGNGSGAGFGQWQYWSGLAWVNIGAASTAAAVVLNASTLIRFDPAANYNGAAPALTVHLIESGGAAITDGTTRNLTGATGGTGVYSTATVTIGQAITAVNDAPTHGLPGAQTFDEDVSRVFSTGNGNAITVSDVDAGSSPLTMTLSVQHGTLTLGGTTGLSFTTGSGSGDATMTFSGTASAINAALNGLTYAPTANYNGTDTLSITTSDGGASGADPGTSGGAGDEVGSGTLTLNISAVNDAPDAQADSGGTTEDAMVAIDVTANDDIDGGDALTVTEIDGNAIGTGGFVILASGALVILNANGTLSYDPNGQYNALVAPGSGTGAVNTSATDSFTYTLSGGTTATVTVTITGVTSPGDQLGGDGGNNSITGTSGNDIFMLDGGGDDTASGGDGVDGFYMGGGLSAGDVIDGGASNDLLGLQGDYNGYTFSATNLIGIETLVLLSGSFTQYSGGTGAERHDYDLTTIDANVAAGQMLLVNATQLLAGEDLRFDGSAETDGSFFFYAGAGNDTLIGGAGNDIFVAGEGQDTLTGGGGADVFYYRFEAESPDAMRDSITDFAAGDMINVWALGEPGGLGISFIGGDAFSNVAGQMRVTGSGTSWAVEIDVDGDGTADFAIDVTTTVSGYAWSESDFIM